MNHRVARRTEIDQYLNTLLDVARFRDYGPNGLQIEGKPEIRKIVSGVTASLAFIDAAIEAEADAVLVHHGLFWRGHDGRITGWLKARIERLLARQVSLFAYHLPLDAHPEWGNNAQLGRLFGWQPAGTFGEQNLGVHAELPAPLTLDELGAQVFLTGEISEPQAHYARETGVAFVAAGHHATERYGAPALAAHLAQHFGLEHQFIDIDNPA
jgi:putative NIF3 family GTP cyclohydrolase 1 type 2